MSDEAVDHPKHYNAHPSGIECIEISRLCMSNMGQAVQYIWRAEDKNGVEDYCKAAWFLRDLMANGLSHYPPFHAKVLLRRAIKADDVPRRAFLLQCILEGNLHRAVEHIDMIAFKPAGQQ